MRDKSVVVSLLVLSAILPAGCALDEILALDVKKNKCKDVQYLEVYDYDEGGHVKAIRKCRAGEDCAKDNNYRGALAYGICPNDLPECREGEEGNYCAACSVGLIVCGKTKSSVICVDPLTHKDYCGARGLCNSDDAESSDYRGEACGDGFICQQGKCTPDHACDENRHYPLCSGNDVIDCKDGVEVTRAKCENQDLVCDAGECKAKMCEDLGIEDQTCSEDGSTYRTCDAEGRVEYTPCNLTCRDGEGCVPWCDNDACYEDEAQRSLLRVCEGGKFVDRSCPEHMYCNSGRCACEIGDKICGAKGESDIGAGQLGDSGVKECVLQEDGSTVWEMVEICANEKPVCDPEYFFCHDGIQGIGSPCQLLYKDEQGIEHVCDGSNEAEPYCSDIVSGAEMASYVNKNIDKILGHIQIMSYWKMALLTLESIKEYFVYRYNIFPRDPSRIRGCRNVEVPPGMALGCMTSQAQLVMPELDNFWPFLAMAFSESKGSLRWMNRFLVHTLGATEDRNGIQFTAPDGYCFVGAYDLTLTGYYFNLFFSNETDEGTHMIGGFHTNTEKKISGLVDIANTPSHHTEASETIRKGGCPEGSIGFSLSEPLMYQTETRQVFGSGPKINSVDFMARIGTDLCLKACETDADCRSGYQCLMIPTVSACAYESFEDVVKRGDFKKACLALETYKLIEELRNIAYWGMDKNGDTIDVTGFQNGQLVKATEVARPTADSDYCRDGLCCGSLERDWATENASCDRVFEHNDDDACVPMLKASDE
ncbi:MAG: hypothetical protein IKY83_09120 [Proteobacteria bacterium]|nr:hypothetical protein [Pseudomonadota bacterium]